MLTIIGDVHGEYQQYKTITDKLEASVQLGDFGFNYDIFTQIHGDHLFFKGNHDNYDVTHQRSLGDFGYRHMGKISFFFVRGGYSIDQKFRIPFVNWWPNEELNTTQSVDCLKLYKTFKPSVVISHEPPSFISQQVGNPAVLSEFELPPDFKSQTGILLETLYETHQPDLWICGHMHKSKQIKTAATQFVVLNKLETFEIK